VRRIVLAVNASKSNADLAHVRGVLRARKVLVVHVRLGWMEEFTVTNKKIIVVGFVSAV
jgi:hypothetical protein